MCADPILARPAPVAPDVLKIIKHIGYENFPPLILPESKFMEMDSYVKSRELPRPPNLILEKPDDCNNLMQLCENED